MANIVIDIASEFSGKAAFAKAEGSTASLMKSVKSLGKQIGVVYSTQKVLAYAKASVKAYAADDKAAKILTRSLDNLGLAFADPAVKTFISDLETQYHVLDDKLRPAYQKLLTTTGDWKKSQDLLKTSLDLSAMSGNDLQSTVDDIARAYAGNTKGLQKYGLGLSKTELAAMSFEDVLKKITQVSKGQATESANTYAGALDALTVSAANAQEVIGKGLVQAFTEAAGSNGIGAMQNGIADLASGISDAIVGTERLVKLFLMTADFDFKGAIQFYKETKKADMLSRQQYGGAAATKYLAEAQAAADKKALARARELAKAAAAKAAAEKAALKAKKDAALLDKAALMLAKGNDVFNLDAIELNAAMINQTEQLGKVTSQAQLLAITNDIARLRVKQDILDLENAIAAGDAEAATAAAAKLGADLKILGALTGQTLEMGKIKSILDAIVPKDLINLDNLRKALDLLGQINLASTGSKTVPSGTTPTVPTTPVSPSSPATFGSVATKEAADAINYFGQSVTDAFQSLDDSTAFNALVNAYAGGAINPFNAGTFRTAEGGSVFSSGSVGAYDKNYNITIQANTIANPDELTNLIQDAIIKINRQGGSLTQAGSL
jgi:hypothetical protein